MLKRATCPHKTHVQAVMEHLDGWSLIKDFRHQAKTLEECVKTAKLLCQTFSDFLCTDSEP